MVQKRICLTGAQGTGKTTVLNIFKEHGWPVVTEVVRNLVKEKGITINQDGTNETQMLVFNTYKDILGSKDHYVSDRGLTDVMGYTAVGVIEDKVDSDILIKQCEALQEFVEDNRDIVYVYFPIEFPVVADGTRSTDEDYRTAVDESIHDLLNDLGDFDIDYLTVHGTPEERFNQIMEYIGDSDRA